jgi:hypothetical protein
MEDHSTNKGNYKTCLTLTGLLMEGLGFSFATLSKLHFDGKRKFRRAH